MEYGSGEELLVGLASLRPGLPDTIRARQRGLQQSRNKALYDEVFRGYRADFSPYCPESLFELDGEADLHAVWSVPLLILP
jgi:hypothetical protein